MIEEIPINTNAEIINMNKNFCGKSIMIWMLSWLNAVHLKLPRKTSRVLVQKTGR